MATEGDSSRRYPGEEVRLLLKRAAELESQGGALPARTEGAFALARGVFAGTVRRRVRTLARLTDELGRAAESDVMGERTRLGRG